MAFGPVTFHDDAAPTMPIAMAEVGPGAGVVIATVSLEPVWDVISQASLTEGQHAYLVDGRGRLIAHPDLGLVREGTDLSSSAQVRAVREGMVRDDSSTAAPKSWTRSHPR